MAMVQIFFWLSTSMNYFLKKENTSSQTKLAGK
jgi:hypothetical protein